MTFAGINQPTHHAAEERSISRRGLQGNQVRERFVGSVAREVENDLDGPRLGVNYTGFPVQLSPWLLRKLGDCWQCDEGRLIVRR